jgi:uncharacterized protein (DUF362 family)
MRLSRRSWLQLTGAGALCMGVEGVREINAQHPPEPVLQLPPQPIVPVNHRSTVSLVRGDVRRKMVYEALVAIDADIRPLLKRKKKVLIKPNCVGVANQLASTHLDTLLGIMDYLAPRYKGEVVIAESSFGDTNTAYENFNYRKATTEHKSLKTTLVDLNEEGKYVTIPLIDYNVHVTPVRIASRLVDPDAFIISSAMFKSHNAVVATASVKNMAMGAPLRSAKKETPAWDDKRKYHVGAQQHNYNIMLTAQRLAPHWGVAVVDGYEGMEGNGPQNGTPVLSRVVLASTDFIAADRVAMECMGVNPNWIGYLLYCEQVGLGNYDIAKIDVRGDTIASVKRTYRLHPDVDRQLLWMGPIGTDNPGTRGNPANRGGRRG